MLCTQSQSVVTVARRSRARSSTFKFTTLFFLLLVVLPLVVLVPQGGVLPVSAVQQL